MDTVGKANVLCQVLARKEPTLDSSQTAWLEYNLGMKTVEQIISTTQSYCYPPSFSDIMK